MATILADRVEAATGIKPHQGTLDIPGQLDPDNDMVIDTLPLDYSILEEIDYQYPASNAYYAYMTRGCVNKCKFCAVPKLEPIYKEYLPVSEQVRIAEARYGAKRDLLLLQYIWTRKPGSQSGFLSISCLSYNKRSNWLTFTSLGFYARKKDC